MEARTAFRRHARGNTLFYNRGRNLFADITLAANVNRGRWAWSSNFVDFNNDGLQDLVVANAFVTNENSNDL